MLGKWIDGLTEGSKDRIIEAQRWCSEAIYESHTNSYCLVGHVYGGTEGVLFDAGVELVSQTTGRCFDRLVQRFGLPRLVRACKLRAAKQNKVLLQQPQQSKLQHTQTHIAGD